MSYIMKHIVYKKYLFHIYFPIIFLMLQKIQVKQNYNETDFVKIICMN